MGNKYTLYKKQSQIFKQSKQSNQYWMTKSPKQTSKSFYQNITYLWIDSNIYNVQNTVLLRTFKTYYKTQTYSTLQLLINKIKQSPLQIFRVISSATIGDQVCQNIAQCDNVVHIYIFCSYLPAGQALKLKYPKVKAVSNCVDDFLKKLEDQYTQDNKYKVLPVFVSTSEDKTKLNNLRYNLHGFKIMKNRQAAKNDFIRLAQIIYKHQKDNNIQLYKTNFPLNPSVQQTIQQYSKQSFYYKLLNNLLRNSTDPLQLAYIRLPFIETFNSIRILYKNYSIKQFKVYRGGWISNENFQYIKQNKGKLIQILGFMSTSKIKQKAQGFVKNVLFTIEIPNNSRSQQIDYGYADIQQFSKYPQQQQVLFNALNVFKILEVNTINNVHHIVLKYGQLAYIYKKYQNNQIMTEQQSIEIANYKHQNQKIKQIKTQGDILIKCQKYQQALKFYEKIQQKKIQRKKKIETISGIDMYLKFGINFNKKGQYDKSIEAYKKSLKIISNIKTKNNIDFAKIYNHIGLAYRNKGDYSQALNYYQKSLQIYYQILGQKHIEVAKINNNIGALYLSLGYDNLALQYYQKSLQIYLNTNSQNNADIAITYNNIGAVYNKTKNYQLALKYYQKSLKLTLDVLGQNHTDVAALYNNIGTIYDSKGNYKLTLQFYDKALSIYLNILGQINVDVARIYNNIGSVYNNKQNYEVALIFYQKSLKICLDVLGQNHTDTATLYNNIATIFKIKQDYQLSLEYYQKAICIYLKILGQQNIEVANSYNNIGLVYNNKGDYKSALQNYKKCLKIKINILGQQNGDVGKSYTNCGIIYLCLNDKNSAYNYFQNGYKIYNKLFGNNNANTLNCLTKMNECLIEQKQKNIIKNEQ